eukprot:3694369-Amphidinium_carterae.2
MFNVFPFGGCAGVIEHGCVKGKSSRGIEKGHRREQWTMHKDGKHPAELLSKAARPPTTTAVAG